GGLRRRGKAWPVAFLVLLLAPRAGVALDGADPALLRKQPGHRLALDKRRCRDLDRLRRAADQRAAAAERRVAAELGLRRRDLFRQGPPLPPVAGEQRVEPGRLRG